MWGNAHVTDHPDRQPHCPPLTGAAPAETKIIQGYGQADVERACRSAKGTPTGIAGVTYGCRKENCDGKGGTCSITCTDPLNCLAETPESLGGDPPPIGVLLNGRVTRDTPKIKP